MTIKVIFQLGDPRQGKGDRENYYVCLRWLYRHKFETLMGNLNHVPTFACYKALLDTLMLLVDPTAYDDKRPARGFRSPPKEKARELRKTKLAKMRAAAVEKVHSDTKYGRLYEAVAGIFATDLDRERMTMVPCYATGEVRISGLAAKWAPSLGGSHDKYTNIVDGIVQRLYPAKQFHLPGGTHEEYLCFMRQRYKSEYLVPQRSAACVPEHFVGRGQWEKVDYARMASRCRLLYGEKIFRKHDRTRYDEYLAKQKTAAMSGKKVKGIAAGAVLPHEIINEPNVETNKLMWVKMVQDVRESGKFPSALAICDVSGSMSWMLRPRPMDVAITLSLLLAEIAPAPWKNRIITFSKNPTFVTLPEATVDNLAERVRLTEKINWDMNTDFEAVFELLLDMAKKHNVDQKAMPKMLFCFSDMEFDDAKTNYHETDPLTMVREQYRLAGYEMPVLCFWNLRSSGAKPAAYNEHGVLMLSGYSVGMMKSFLEANLISFKPPTPIETMRKTLSKYDALVVAECDVKHENEEEEEGCRNTADEEEGMHSSISTSAATFFSDATSASSTSVSDVSESITMPLFDQSHYQAALYILLPEHLRHDVDEIRAQHDKAYPRWPSHVNLIWPFIEPQHFEQVLEPLKMLCAELKPFNITLPKLNYFDRGQKGKTSVVYLEPSTGCDADLQHLHKMVRSLFGSVAGDKSRAFKPHFTLGQFDSRPTKLQAEMAAMTAQLPLPMQFDCTNISIIAKSKLESDGKFNVIHTIPLTGTELSSPSTVLKKLLRSHRE